MMKSVSTAFVLLGFIGMAGFGFLAMSPQGDMHGCIAALTRGAECPAESNSVSSLSFHAGVLKGFSTATVDGGFLMVFLLLAALALLLWYRSSTDVEALFPALLSRYKQEARFFASPFKQRILRWFSLHENSPAGA